MKTVYKEIEFTSSKQNVFYLKIGALVDMDFPTHPDLYDYLSFYPQCLVEDVWLEDIFGDEDPTEEENKEILDSLSNIFEDVDWSDCYHDEFFDNMDDDLYDCMD